MGAETAEVHRDLGKHDAQIDALERDVKRLSDEMSEMRKEFTEQLSKINETLSEAKGGWRTLMWVGGAGATFGIAIAKLIGWLVDSAPR